MHTSASRWLSEALPAWTGPSRDEAKKSAINTTRKWRKESWTGPAQSQNYESAPRLLVKCDNLLASQAGLSMTGVRWAAQSCAHFFESCANFPGTSHSVDIDTKQHCRMNAGHPTQALAGRLKETGLQTLANICGFFSKTTPGNVMRVRWNQCGQSTKGFGVIFLLIMCFI